MAKAETRCIGPTPALRSWLRREVLPQIATRSAPGSARPRRFDGQLSRTQAEKAAENSAGLIRFIRIVSHRSPGTPSA